MPHLHSLTLFTAPKRPAAAIAWVGGGVIVPAAVRWAITPLVHNSVPYLTFFPAVLLVTLALSWEFGLLVTAVSTVLAYFLFARPNVGFSFDGPAIAGAAMFLVASAVIIFVASTLRVALRRLERATERQAHLTEELAHRAKNTLAVVQGLASQAARTAPSDPAAFYREFRDRVHALGQAYDLLLAGGWECCEAAALVETALDPFDLRRFTLAGPPCVMPSASCIPLVLSLHELATNAVKYGALSVEGGVVNVSWSVDGSEEPGAVALIWQETGGPPVTPPKRRGLGSRLLVAQKGVEAVELKYRPEGVTCAIRVPLGA